MPTNCLRQSKWKANVFVWPIFICIFNNYFTMITGMLFFATNLPCKQSNDRGGGGGDGGAITQKYKANSRHLCIETLRSPLVDKSNMAELLFVFYLFLCFLFVCEFFEPICFIFQRNHHGYAIPLILCPLLKSSNAVDSTPKRQKKNKITRQKLVWIKQSAAYLSSMQCNTAEFSKCVCEDALNSIEFRCHSNSISIPFLLLFKLMLLLNFIVCCYAPLRSLHFIFNRISFLSF